MHPARSCRLFLQGLSPVQDQVDGDGLGLTGATEDQKTASGGTRGEAGNILGRNGQRLRRTELEGVRIRDRHGHDFAGGGAGIGFRKVRVWSLGLGTFEDRAIIAAGPAQARDSSRASRDARPKRLFPHG